jgi:hypothetical protein
MQTLIAAGKDMATQSIRAGWFNALKEAGHKCLIWEPKNKPVFDIFDEHKPQLVLLHTSDLNHSLSKCLLNNKEIEIMLWGSAQPTDNEKHYVDVLHKLGNLKKILVNSTKHYDYQVPFFPCLPAADHLRYNPVDTKKRIDVSYIGLYKRSKVRSIHDYLYYSIAKGYNTQIFGASPWPITQYLGRLTSSEAYANIVGASHYNLNIIDRDGCAINERVFKILACNGLCLCERSTMYSEIFQNTNVMFFDNQTEFLEILNSGLKASIINDGRSFLFSEGHTYLQRARSVFDALGLKDKKLEDLCTNLV